ncbi:MAG: hypothetical protein LAO22_19745 [Acidobacteriia bacterium]|nr:hypothetical protein [Terriglobia bacterium]
MFVYPFFNLGEIDTCGTGMQLLQRFQQHEFAYLNGLKGTQKSFVRVGMVFKIDTGSGNEGVELGVMLRAERHREPRHKILPTGMVVFDFLSAADHTPAHA